MMMGEFKLFIFKVNPNMHKQIKILAARHNVSMNLLICRAIEQYLKKETQYDRQDEKELT
jgi:predicted HicB family RNase H-like nuclease